MKEKIIKLIPNMFTMSNLICGVMAIIISFIYTSQLAITISCILIFAGVFCDTFDGITARKLKVESEFGKELDSFADAVSFCIAPMCILLSFVSLYKEITIIEIIVIAIYMILGVFRLVRFNCTDYNGYFVGVPTTICGCLFSIYILILNILSINLNGVINIISFSIIFILAILMVSKIKVKRVKK